MEEATPIAVLCRAHATEKCYHGTPLRDSAYNYHESDPGDDHGDSLRTCLSNYRSDNTYRNSDATVVCDACYIAMGTPTTEQLDRIFYEPTMADLEPAWPVDYGDDAA